MGEEVQASDAVVAAEVHAQGGTLDGLLETLDGHLAQTAFRVTAGWVVAVLGTDRHDDWLAEEEMDPGELGEEAHVGSVGGEPGRGESDVEFAAGAEMVAEVCADLVGVHEVLEGVLGVDDVVGAVEGGGEFYGEIGGGAAGDGRGELAWLDLYAGSGAGSKFGEREGLVAEAATEVEDVGAMDGGGEVGEDVGVGEGVCFVVVDALHGEVGSGYGAAELFEYGNLDLLQGQMALPGGSEETVLMVGDYIQNGWRRRRETALGIGREAEFNEE